MEIDTKLVFEITTDEGDVIYLDDDDLHNLILARSAAIDELDAEDVEDDEQDGEEKSFHEGGKVTVGIDPIISFDLGENVDLTDEGVFDNLPDFEFLLEEDEGLEYERAEKFVEEELNTYWSPMVWSDDEGQHVGATFEDLRIERCELGYTLELILMFGEVEDQAIRFVVSNPDEGPEAIAELFAQLCTEVNSLTGAIEDAAQDMLGARMIRAIHQAE